MRKLICTLSIVFVFYSSLLAQQDTCNCLDNLNRLVAKTEENYAGFPAKVTKKEQPAYKLLVQSLKARTAKVQSPKACYYLLKEYVRFFKDKHFILVYANEKDHDKEIINLTEAAFKNYLRTNRIAPVEGIWINADASMKFAIKKTGINTFKAIVLESNDPGIQKGLVYVTFTVTPKGFLAKEYDSFITTDIPARQTGNLLQIWNQKMFGKVFPSAMTASENAELNTWKNNNNGLAFKQLSAKTAYLKVPTFRNNDDKIQQLVLQSDSIIKTCENLIVDLTGNGGGNTGWISFLSYFITNPIVQYDSYVRVTPENVQYKLKDLELFAVNEIPAEYKKYFPDNVLQAYKNAYKELPVTKQAFYPVPGVTFPVDSLLPKPGKIALLVDDYCGSSTEYFFFLSKQSKKTKTYGVNTIGMMDYEGMSYPTAMPYDKFIVTIPIVKSSWTDKAPIDQKGFQPDVLLDKIERQKWVEFVQRSLEKN